MIAWVRALDRQIVSALRRRGVAWLRLALGIVFVWFGALKLIGRSPVADLVARTVPFLPDHAAVLAMGVWELGVGLAFLFRKALRVTVALFLLQMAGTFLVLIREPGRALQEGNPLLLTQTGEFVIKNLVLMAAGLVVGATADAPHEAIKPVESPVGAGAA